MFAWLIFMWLVLRENWEWLSTKCLVMFFPVFSALPSTSVHTLISRVYTFVQLVLWLYKYFIFLSNKLTVCRCCLLWRCGKKGQDGGQVKKKPGQGGTRQCVRHGLLWIGSYTLGQADFVSWALCYCADRSTTGSLFFPQLRKECKERGGKECRLVARHRATSLATLSRRLIAVSPSFPRCEHEGTMRRKSMEIGLSWVGVVARWLWGVVRGCGRWVKRSELLIRDRGVLNKWASFQWRFRLSARWSCLCRWVWPRSRRVILCLMWSCVRVCTVLCCSLSVPILCRLFW